MRAIALLTVALVGLAACSNAPAEPPAVRGSLVRLHPELWTLNPNDLTSPPEPRL